MANYARHPFRKSRVYDYCYRTYRYKKFKYDIRLFRYAIISFEKISLADHSDDHPKKAYSLDATTGYKLTKLAP